MPPTKTLDPLTRAAIRSGSDKYGGHLYTPIYHKLFASRREEPLRLLEIGVGGYAAEQAGGLGLKMWAEYFPHATIVGLDVQTKRLAVSPRIHVVQGSQADTDILEQVSQEYGPFDVVIDDGSHVVSHMLTSFNVLYPLLAVDGIYAVEDTQTCFAPATGGGPDGTATIFELAHKIGLMMHRLEGYSDGAVDPQISRLAEMTQSVAVYRNIVVFHRGANTYPSNIRLDLSNEEVQTVFDGIAAQNEWDPSPAGVLSRIDMLIWGGKPQEAATLAMQAAAAHPRDVSLLYELLRMMEWAGQDHPQVYISALLSRAR